MSDTLRLSWTPPGPVSQRFMASNRSVQIVNGPIGSGKTTTCLMKTIRLAQRQAISTRDTTTNATGARVPVRKFRLCVVRDTYRQLWKTTLPSWFKRIPRTMGEFTGSENAPATHRVPFALADGSVCEFQVDFVAIGDNSAEDVLRGYEVTCFYLNEADLLAKEVYTYARGRTGRFPDMAEGGPTWHGVLMDCNAPELGSWLYEDYFERSEDDLAARGVALFRQPGGMEPGAENRANLPPGYYESQLTDQPDWYIQRMIHNRPGFSRAGKPVFPEFNDALHVAANDLAYLPGLPLLIGMDAGLNPAAAIGQRMPSGVWRILDEIVPPSGTGPLRFAQALTQRLRERFSEARTILAYADPSAAYGADKQGGERSWIEIVEAEAAIRVLAAPTNALVPRLEAVRLPLTRLIDGGSGFILSPRCLVLRRALNAGYRYRKKTGTEDQHNTDSPEKNEFSHPADALQYLCSGGGEDAEIRSRKKTSEAARARTSARQPDWDPFA